MTFVWYDWKVKPGHNKQAEVVAIGQNPKMPRGILGGDFRWNAGGGGSDHGWLQADLYWNIVKRADRGTILGKFGLSDTTKSALVTVYIRENDDTMGYFNATAILVDSGERQQGWWNNLHIRLNKLVEVSAPSP